MVTITTPLKSCFQCRHRSTAGLRNITYFCSHPVSISENDSNVLNPVGIAITVADFNSIPNWCPLKNGHKY